MPQTAFDSALQTANSGLEETVLVEVPSVNHGAAKAAEFDPTWRNPARTIEGDTRIDPLRVKQFLENPIGYNSFDPDGNLLTGKNLLVPHFVDSSGKMNPAMSVSELVVRLIQADFKVAQTEIDRALQEAADIGILTVTRTPILASRYEFKNNRELFDLVVPVEERLAAASASQENPQPEILRDYGEEIKFMQAVMGVEPLQNVPAWRILSYFIDSHSFAELCSCAEFSEANLNMNSLCRDPISQVVDYASNIGLLSHQDREVEVEGKGPRKVRFYCLTELGAQLVNYARDNAVTDASERPQTVKELLVEPEREHLAVE